MNKRLSIIFSFLALLGLSAVFSVQSVVATPPASVTICHATASNTNPYVTESPNIQNDGSLTGGHLNHTGPLYPASNWGDIIPAYTSGSFVYPGMNWTSAGQAILNNGCAPVTNTPTPTITQSIVTLAPTTTPTPTVTPTGVQNQVQNPTGTPTPTPNQGNNQSCTGNICITIACNGGGTCEVDLGNTPTPTSTPVTPTPTPTSGPSNNSSSSNSNNSNDGGSSNGSSSSGNVQAVLGTTTMASTGTFETNAMNFMLLSGMLVLLAGFGSYVREQKA